MLISESWSELALAVWGRGLQYSTGISVLSYRVLHGILKYGTRHVDRASSRSLRDLVLRGPLLLPTRTEESNNMSKFFAASSDEEEEESSSEEESEAFANSNLSRKEVE